ncbi:25S rRNA (adenine645-N1)-methyltransferase [Dinochytrium kinnereticum]|nr:25S rRNA (adenine645-N1)-methyltransferase [Dinochytrium kinnereticum]
MADGKRKRKSGEGAIARRKKARGGEVKGDQAAVGGKAVVGVKNPQTGTTGKSTPQTPKAGIRNESASAKGYQKTTASTPQQKEGEAKSKPYQAKSMPELVTTEVGKEKTASSPKAPSSVQARKDELRLKLTQALLKSKSYESCPKGAPAAKPAKGKAAAQNSNIKASAASKNSKEKAASSASASTPESSGLTELQAKMKKKLAGGNFRFINEKLYTTRSEESFKLFTSSPSLFDVYHEGFRSQVELWPSNPVDLFIHELKSRPATKSPLVIADLGCGEAKLAEALLALNPPDGPARFTPHSFDLVAPNERVVACDIKNVPLKNGTVDVAIFCLALMGTNFLDFLGEAWRILKPNGELKIAEVTSRFPDVQEFIKTLEGVGFKLKSKDESNKMFIMFSFIKQSAKKGKVKVENPEQLLQPCIYKKR